MKTVSPTILVIVGISGDLARRKLLPAIRKIHQVGLLPDKFRIIGTSRHEITPDQVLPSGEDDFLKNSLELCSIDLSKQDDYPILARRISAARHKMGDNVQTLFYLSVPPQVTKTIVELLGRAKLLETRSSKLLLEKPFGTDLESARELVDHLASHCYEDQIYRIDHYMAKEMAQNLIVFRSGNPLIGGTWNKDFIQSIEILASEKIGIEGRAGLYEQLGALKDVVQSHLLQLAALVLMDLPDIRKPGDIAAKRLRALESLKIPQDIRQAARRAQYEGYREEAGNPRSTTETFASLKLFSADPRWEGVPVTLTAGKALGQRVTEIRVNYRQRLSPHTNSLVLRIQPGEAVTLNFWVKRPGYDYEMQPLPLVLAYGHHFAELPDAYERVFADAMRSERALFTTSQEVLAAWRILQPVLDNWAMSDGEDLAIYKAGNAPRF